MNNQQKEQQLIQRSQNQNFITEMNSRINNDIEIEIIDINRDKYIYILLILFSIGIIFGCKKKKLF